MNKTLSYFSLRILFLIIFCFFQPYQSQAATARIDNINNILDFNNCNSPQTLPHSLINSAVEGRNFNIFITFDGLLEGKTTDIPSGTNTNTSSGGTGFFTIDSDVFLLRVKDGDNKTLLNELNSIGASNSRNSITFTDLILPPSSFPLTFEIIEANWVDSVINPGQTDPHEFTFGSTLTSFQLSAEEAINQSFCSEIAQASLITNNKNRTKTKRIISNFMSRRADQITANDPELVNRLQNRGSEGETGQFAGFTAEGTLTNNKLAFSTSLRQMIIAKEQKKSQLRKGLGDMMSLGTQNLTQNIDPNGWDLWVKGTWAQTESDTASNDLGLLYLGVDYRYSSSLLIGFLTQFDWTDEKDSVETFKVEGQGWMAGPYMVARLHENLLFDGRAAWGQSSNDVSPFDTYTDQFDTTRWLLRGQFTGDFKAANWHFAPHVGVIYFEESQDAYTDSLNVFIPGQTISLGRLTFGPKISTTIETTDGTIISPHLSLKGIWDFDKAEIVDLDTGIAMGSSEELRARVEGGLSVQMSNGWSLNGEGFYDGIGVNDLEAYGGSIKLSVPLN